MKNTLQLIAMIFIISSQTVFSQVPDVSWSTTAGGSLYEYSYGAAQLADNGFLIAGESSSFGNGWSDIYLVRLDSEGNEVWSYVYGENYDDWANTVLPLSDGSFIIAGNYELSSGGSTDVYLMRIADNGGVIWQTTWGGNQSDYVYNGIVIENDEVVLCGSTYSQGSGSADVLLLKYDQDGNVIWSRTYGGTDYEEGLDVIQTSDGGFAIAGVTASYGNNEENGWLIKTGSTGYQSWARTFGGNSFDFGTGVLQAADGGYFVTGYTGSYGNGQSDMWLIKTTSAGYQSWSRTYGGTGDDYCNGSCLTIDGKVILLGNTTSYGAGNADMWFLCTDASGNQLWNLPVGDAGWDYGSNIINTADRGLFAVGNTWSSGAGANDVYCVRLEGNLIISAPQISIDFFNNQPIISWNEVNGALEYNVYSYQYYNSEPLYIGTTTNTIFYLPVTGRGFYSVSAEF